MSRKKKQTRRMKIKDDGAEIDSRYAIKSYNAKKKGIFTKNSPFNPINHHPKPLPFAEVCDTYTIVEAMIEKNRGVSDAQLTERKQQVNEPREEALQSG